jgi:DNA processing protein
VPLRSYLQLSLTSGIGPILIGRLIEAAGSAEAACAPSAAMLARVEGIGSVKAGQIARALHQAAQAADAEEAKAQALGVRLLCLADADYPELLKTIPDPPVVLYLKGTLEPRDLNAVAVVGSRKCSYYGREQAERFGALLAGAGVTVISGGARGTDSAAHRGAMQPALGRTIAVLGSGIDVPYPPENKALFEQIAARGAVISEMPLGTPPNRENFPRRNRIVSGLSRGVLVIEADVRSGALITARQAADDHNRPVFALPGRVDNALSAGPHLLIRDGATLVTNLEEILEGLGPLPHGAMVAAPSSAEDVPPIEMTEDNGAKALPAPAPAAIGLSPRQREILLQMGSEPSAVEMLIDRTALPAQVILQELMFLSLKGLVRRIDGQTYARRG